MVESCLGKLFFDFSFPHFPVKFWNLYLAGDGRERFLEL